MTFLRMRLKKMQVKLVLDSESYLRPLMREGEVYWEDRDKDEKSIPAKKETFYSSTETTDSYNYQNVHVGRTNYNFIKPCIWVLFVLTYTRINNGGI